MRLTGKSMASLIRLATLLVIFGRHTHALYTTTVCLPKGEINAGTLTSVYIASINPYITTDKFNASSSSCTPALSYDAVDLELHDCFLCDMNPTTNVTETDRFYTLSDINDNINSIITEIDSRLGEITTLSYMTYASANFVPPRGRCNQFNYPRICLLDLFNLIGATQEPLTSELNTFLFSMHMDTDSQIVSFEMSNNIGPNYWFGVGFSDISMEGDCAVVSTDNGFQPYTVADYFITVTSPRSTGVVRDAQQDYNNINVRFVDGVYTIEWDRAFDTGDANDFVLDGTEKDISLYAAVGVDTDLGDHNGAFNSVTSRTVRFVPSPSDSDRMWCDRSIAADCLIAVNPQTNDPSENPTDSPTLSDDPTTMPTNNPIGTPSVAPTAGPPRVGPTAVTQSPTQDDSSANSIFKQSLLLFLIVASVCVY